MKSALTTKLATATKATKNMTKSATKTSTTKNTAINDGNEKKVSKNNDDVDNNDVDNKKHQMNVIYTVTLYLNVVIVS